MRYNRQSMPRLDTAMQIIQELDICLDDLKPGKVNLEELSISEFIRTLANDLP